MNNMKSQMPETLDLPQNIFKQAVDNALDIIMITEVNSDDPGNNRIIYVNEAFIQHFGYERDEVIGKSPRMLQGEDTNEETRFKIREALSNGWPIDAEIINYDKQGKKYWIDLKMVPLYGDDDHVTHYLFIERDLSERKSKEQQLYEKATIDDLTQLFNRHHTYQLASQAIEKAQRYQTTLSAIMLDIDHFKEVNDTYGHPTGDKVLTKLSKLIKDQVRKADIVGRVGGEEFFILLPEVSVEEAHAMAERIRSSVERKSWRATGVENGITISLGVTEYHNDNLESLIAKSDKSLYHAKKTGRNRVIKFNDIPQ